MNEEIQKYHKILCNDYPIWLDEYINTKEMQRIGNISSSCGTNYSGMYKHPYFYSNLDHSIGVALIIWKFTKCKKQTLSGLFHDIATPVFKHCIDFMNKDYEKQESTEEKTFDIINSSKEIKRLLDRDSILVNEVCNYKRYTIADNDTPQLSADRLEYTFSSGLVLNRVWELDLIEKVYNNLTVGKNESNEDEIMFKDLEICEEYIDIISKLWLSWVDDTNRTVMQFLADITKKMINEKYLTVDMLYTMSEKEVIQKIKECNNISIKKAFEYFENMKEIYSSKEIVNDRYCIYTKTKVRYVNPFVLGNDRVYNMSKISKEKIDKYLDYKKEGITYLNLEFNIDI